MGRGLRRLLTGGMIICGGVAWAIVVGLDMRSNVPAQGNDATIAALTRGQWHHISLAVAFLTDGGGAVATVTVDGNTQTEAIVQGTDDVVGVDFTPAPATVQLGNVYSNSPGGGDFTLTSDNVVVRF